MNNKQALKILEINSKNPTTPQIKKAFRMLSKKYHPDLNNDPEAALKFLKVYEAYQTLLKGTGDVDQQFYDFNTLAKAFYEKDPLPRPDLAVINYGIKHLDRVKVPLECFLFQEPFIFNVDVLKACPECYGHPEVWIPCNLCKQVGSIMETTNAFPGFRTGKCKQCKGVGWIRKSICKLCHDKMKIVFNREVQTIIPMGYYIGSVLTIKNQGNIGWNSPDGHIKFTPTPDFDLTTASEEDLHKLRELLNKIRKAREI